jgi:hypothetical protein
MVRCNVRWCLQQFESIRELTETSPTPRIAVSNAPSKPFLSGSLARDRSLLSLVRAKSEISKCSCSGFCHTGSKHLGEVPQSR